MLEKGKAQQEFLALMKQMPILRSRDWEAQQALKDYMNNREKVIQDYIQLGQSREEAEVKAVKFEAKLCRKLAEDYADGKGSWAQFKDKERVQVRGLDGVWHVEWRPRRR